MGQTWDSTPTRTAGRHRAHTTSTSRRATLRALILLTISGLLLATILATLATRPAALTAVGYWIAYPVAIMALAVVITRTALRAVGR